MEIIGEKEKVSRGTLSQRDTGLMSRGEVETELYIYRQNLPRLVREAYAHGYSDGFAKYSYHEPIITELFELKVV